MLADTNAIELVAQAQAATSLRADGGNPINIATTVADFTGDNLTNAIATAKMQLSTPTVSSLTAVTANGALR